MARFIPPWIAQHALSDVQTQVESVGVSEEGKTFVIHNLTLSQIVPDMLSQHFIANLTDEYSRNQYITDQNGEAHVLNFPPSRVPTRPKWMLQDGYLNRTAALIILVDSSDPGRLKEMAREVRYCSVYLVLATNQDALNAIPLPEISSTLNLASDSTTLIQPVKGKDGAGLAEGLTWLSQTLATKIMKNEFFTFTGSLSPSVVLSRISDLVAGKPVNADLAVLGPVAPRPVTFLRPRPMLPPYTSNKLASLNEKSTADVVPEP